MNLSLWCEHDEKTSKYSTVKYCFEDKEVLLRVQTWVCPVCGIHGSNTELAPGGRAAALIGNKE